jgi:uncharacterized protein (DUF952 family)
MAGGERDFRWAAGYDRVMTPIYKICTASEWRDAERAGVYRGSAVDVKDGFIHFSTAEQAAETAAKWFARQRDLVLVAVDADALGDKLKWEPSRGGALFPHLYGELSLKAVQRVDPLPLDETGRHCSALRSLMFVRAKE